MNYSIALFSDLIFNISEIISIPEIFNNFSSCEVLDFQMVELIFFYIPNYKFLKLEIFGWDTNYRMIKCRTTGVS